MEAAERRFLLNGLTEVFLTAKTDVSVKYFKGAVFVAVRNRHGGFNYMTYDWNVGCIALTDTNAVERLYVNHCKALDQVRIWAGLKRTTCTNCGKQFTMHHDCSVVKNFPEDHVCDTCIEKYQVTGILKTNEITSIL